MKANKDLLLASAMQQGVSQPLCAHACVCVCAGAGEFAVQIEEKLLLLLALNCRKNLIGLLCAAQKVTHSCAVCVCVSVCVGTNCHKMPLT